jgi:K+-transporting ATPase ATPase C chain
MLLILFLVTGIAYPLTITLAAWGLFPHRAAGSLILRKGIPVGSALIGQAFSGKEYFHGRPSASDYDGMASGGSNAGPTNSSWVAVVGRRTAELRKVEGLGAGASVPSDLVTASGSGLDPHISLASALLQVSRVARTRGLSEERLRRLVETRLELPTLGFLGEPRVNVLELNLALLNMK